MQIIDRPLREGLDRYSEERHSLVEACGVALVAAEARKVLGDDPGEAELQGSFGQGMHARTVAQVCARDRFVPEDVGDDIIASLAELDAARDLVFCRCCLLVG